MATDAGITDAEKAELQRLREERAARDTADRAAREAAAAKTAPAAGGVTISEDRLAQLIREAVATGRREAALAGGARPEKPEEIHEHADNSAQLAVEGFCSHPLSAHEFYGGDGYGKCKADGCRCSGRELGADSVRAITTRAKAKAKAAEEGTETVAVPA